MKPQMITVGAGSLRWKLAGDRLARQARKSGWFSSVDAYDTKSLRGIIPTFFSRHEHFITANSRGFGYWLWRPYLLLERVKKLRPNEILLFLDAGCELNVNAKSTGRLFDYMGLAKESGLCLMRNSHLLTSWCKRDTLDVFGVKQNSTLRTVEPGVFFLTNSQENISLLESWIEWAIKENYHHLDDSPSTQTNYLNFIEHRHDQSLLTLLLVDRPETAIEQETYFPHNSWRSSGADYPLWVTRNSHPFLHESNALTSITYRFLRKKLRES